MEQSRPNTRGSVPNINFDNSRRESEPSSRTVKSRSRSPLYHYKDTSTNLMTTSSDYNKTEGFAASISKSQTLSSSQQRTRQSHNISQTDNEVRSSIKSGDMQRKYDGSKRAGSMQMSTYSDAPSTGYNFGPPQSLQTICNGNNLAVSTSLPLSSERNASSGTNTITSGTATTSISSHCKNCKRLEEQERILTYSLNQVLNQVNDIIEKEGSWRQGILGFSLGNFNWINEDDRSIDPQILKRSDSGRLLLEVKKTVMEMRRRFEELILDVESLSKTDLYKDVHLQVKEKRLFTEDLSSSGVNPGKKLLASIADAKQYIDSLRSVVFSEEVPPAIKEEIKLKNSSNKQEPLNKNVLRTMVLQLEQSKRERRALEIELNLQKKRVLQNPNMASTSSLKQMIRQFVEEEIQSCNTQNSP